MSENKGVFVISLDFELYWGLRDKENLEKCKERLLGVRSVVPELLKLFSEYNIHTTWATVGFLFFETCQELTDGLPANKPDYQNVILSPYQGLSCVGDNEVEDPYHYAPTLIKMITDCPYQEIGSHTFSHYYCLEKGQDINSFRADLEAALKIAEKYNLKPESLVFPRNQVNPDYLPVCAQLGIKVYRGNPHSWIYMKKKENESLVRRALRLMDAYVNLTGHNSYTVESIDQEVPLNIPASRFLRPYTGCLGFLEPLRLKRILDDLTYAAKKGQIYHLWWHPHNFGLNIEKNMSFLKKILDHFSYLRQEYEMESTNMLELCQSIAGKNSLTC